jgi:tyrosine-protein phosphatase SIW14
MTSLTPLPRVSEKGTMRNQRLIRASVAIGLAAFLWATPSAQVKESAILGASAVDIDNFGRVSDVYYRGAQPAARDYATLKAFGIATVIDLQADGLAMEPSRVEAAGMKFFRIPMTTRVPPTPAQIAQFLALVGDPANQPVYVHCAGGRHRTGVMTAIHRMTMELWTPDQAFKEMKQYKFGADFLHPEFKRFVYAYPAALPSARQRAPNAIENNVRPRVVKDEMTTEEAVLNIVR